ncbi:hypothetical protein ID866_3316 [Astraeus odoratus]|nr:hypothetical protein ID866_3316 [Astraeus odoratus]
MSDTKNELETLLEQAATEPAHRPAFFRTLLESTVWVPGTAAEGEQVVEDSALDLLHWEKDDGTSVIPFFTSLEALQEAVEDEQARAFLCSIKESADEKPVLLIGIEADGDIDDIIQAAGSVATDTLPGDEPIDICQVKNGEKGISHFITEHITPFYERRWGGFLRDLKTNRII